ncbi:hypothetical protein FSP39_024545 [Pinctada imbricata]|uniref:Sulfotransferase domain-containing protein n=1 Tax=Pinctada imbricata TaxID=66713 RepID=A0AA88XNX1_PINIB|nr:hypothetical protein FSP39_024545 [Pinctada imbricata]
MTGPVQTSLEKTGPRPPVLYECQSDSSGELAATEHGLYYVRSLLISIYIFICVAWAPAFCGLVCVWSSDNEEVVIHHSCTFFENSGIHGSLDEIARQITRDVFSCHIKKLPIKMLYHGHFMGVSRSTAEMNMCQTNLTYMLSCAEALQRKCINSKFVLIKSIRIRAYQLLDIKEDFPDLKVVYLIRDPRAVLASQMNYGMATFRHLNESEFVSEFCMNVTQDTQVVRVFQKFYPGDINVVYHNNFEQNGVAYSRDIYRALGITFNTESKRKILSLTGDGKNCTRSYALCTRKYNSTVEIGKWRTEISFYFARLVDSLCKSVYKSHGFISFDSTKMLQNLSYPSHDTSLSTFKHRRQSEDKEIHTLYSTSNKNNF